MERYRRQIRYDLQRELHVSLGELWNSRRWRELLDFIDMLPQATQTRQAMLADPDHVAMLVEYKERHPEMKAKGPALAEYSPEAARLDTIIDRLGTLTTITLKANGAKSVPKQTLQPRPESIVEDLEHRRHTDASKRIADRAMRRNPEQGQ